jgi:type IV pilus assembly protein PilA
MTQWFYADDARNRIGPISAVELREHYRQRRLRRDSLVWRDGMPQWQALELVAAELELDAVTPDTRVPPPLPAAGTPRVSPQVHATPPKQGMSGCLIAVLVCAALAIPAAGILAAIALPAYNGYLQRAKIMEAIAAVQPLQVAVREHVAGENACPDNGSADLAPLLQQLGQSPRIAAVRVGTLQSGHCAFEITLRGVGVQNDGKTLLFEARGDDASQWDCSGGDLPARVRPPQCRTSPNPTST